MLSSQRISVAPMIDIMKAQKVAATSPSGGMVKGMPIVCRPMSCIMTAKAKIATSTKAGSRTAKRSIGGPSNAKPLAATPAPKSVRPFNYLGVPHAVFFIVF